MNLQKCKYISTKTIIESEMVKVFLAEIDVIYKLKIVIVLLQNRVIQYRCICFTVKLHMPTVKILSVKLLTYTIVVLKIVIVIFCRKLILLTNKKISIHYIYYTEKLFILIFTIVFFNLGKNVSL